MLITKVILDKNCLVPMSSDLWDSFRNYWITKCTIRLNSFMSSPDANKIMSDPFNVAYKDILLYATMTMILEARQMLHLVNGDPDQDVLLNYTPQPLKLKIENNFDSYIDKDCIVLPYRYLADNDANLLIEAISGALTKDLTEDEMGYVRSSFEQYRSVQNELILSDPVLFYKNLRHNVLNS